MRVLFISSSSGLYKTAHNAYNGIGWVAALQGWLGKQPNVELALAFRVSSVQSKSVENGTAYYPIYEKPLNILQKLYFYRRGYRRKVEDRSLVEKVKPILADFRPDIIHIFGTEADYGYLQQVSTCPCVFHLQGLLGPIYNAFFPSGIGLSDFERIGSFREFWLHNGIAFSYRQMAFAAQREERFLREARYALGRTNWDKMVATSINPSLRYFHVDEILRPVFYVASKWQQPIRVERLEIVSTISDVSYKGLDMVLKTATLLHQRGFLFRWRLIGLRKDGLTSSLYNKILRTASLPEIVYMGVQTADDIVSILQQSHLYIHPSQIDNSPNGLCEAQYLGVPTMAVAVGGVPTIMAYEAHRLVAANDPYMMAAKITEFKQELLNNPITLHEGVLKRHDPQHVIDQLMEAYDTIIQAK